VPSHDKALLEGISKHGIGRSDLLLEDPELPFYHIKQGIIEDYEEKNKDYDGDESAIVSEKLAWPKDIIIARRIDSLCELVINPKPLSKRQMKRRLVTDESSEQQSNAKKAHTAKEDDDEMEALNDENTADTDSIMEDQDVKVEEAELNDVAVEASESTLEEKVEYETPVVDAAEIKSEAPHIEEQVSKVEEVPEIADAPKIEEAPKVDEAPKSEAPAGEIKKVEEVPKLETTDSAPAAAVTEELSNSGHGDENMTKNAEEESTA
jgi:hypothetical protein